MSLLMDALKKAEEAKRQAGESDTSPPPLATPTELSLQPLMQEKARSSSTLPNLSKQHLDSVDAELATVPTSAPPRKRQPESAPKAAKTSPESVSENERSAARNVFAVKQQPKSRAPLWLLLGIVSFSAIGIGGYFWWQFQSMSTNSLSSPAAPAQSIANSSNQTPRQIREQPLIALTETQKPEPVRLPPLVEPVRPQAMDTPPAFERRERAPAATPPISPNEADSPIRMSTARPKQNPTLNRAYEALLSDNLNDAQQGYEQVLHNDTKNTDALLGLATIAARQGRIDSATDLYVHVLEADPKNIIAKANLINLRGQSDPGRSESRLKTLLASQPDSAVLLFALGNLYASQSRWNDAQQAYFRACSAEPENADYLFNLAVSLDHLHQNKLAAQHYQMALNAAEIRNAAFDKAQVKSRLLELQP